VIGAAQPGSVCVCCFGAEEGEVLKIAGAAPGSKAEPLHEKCAGRWFAGLVTPDQDRGENGQAV
jgi:hypothetical protein